MTQAQKIIAGLALAATIAAAGTAHAQAADPAVEAAFNAGTIGEKADGFIGVVGSVPGDLKAKVEAINIKRREGYTAVAAQRNVTVREFAASIGCKTLTNLKPGRAYSIDGESWSKKAGAIALPAYCGG